MHSNEKIKLLLMIPLRRCGSHALRLRLNFNSQFYSPYPLHIVDFMELLSLYGDLSDDNIYFQLVIDVIGLQTATMVKWSNIAFDPIRVFEAVAQKPRSIHHIIWEMLREASKQHQASVVMDKSLDSVHYTDELTQLFPEMRFIHVVRDPRAQISSMNRAIIYDFTTLLNAKRWMAAQAAAHDLIKKYPERVLTVRFEDFITDQRGILQKICHFIGIDFLETMLDSSKSTEAVSLSKLSALWQTNALPPIPANVNQFKKQLTLDEIELIETMTAEYMDHYGYEKMTSAQTPILDVQFEQAQQRNQDLRQAAWQQLAQDNQFDYKLRCFRNEYLQNLKIRLLKTVRRVQ